MRKEGSLPACSGYPGHFKGTLKLGPLAQTLSLPRLRKGDALRPRTGALRDSENQPVPWVKAPR